MSIKLNSKDYKELANFRLDFIGVGFPKCATTWLARCLGEHPQISLYKQKESNLFLDAAFFKDFYPQITPVICDTVSKYKSMFPGLCQKGIRGEFGVNYIYSEGALRLIKQLYPNIKILVSLRNPVSAAESAFRYFGSLGRYNSSSLDGAISKGEFDLRPWHFAKYLEVLYRIFESSQIQILIYDDIKSSPEKIFRELFTFLGIDPTFCPSSLHKSVNHTTLPRIAFIDSMGRRVGDFLRHRGYVNLVTALYQPYKFINRRSLNSSSKSSNFPILLDYLEEDIRQLSTLLRKDFSHWKHV